MHGQGVGGFGDFGVADQRTGVGSTAAPGSAPGVTASWSMALIALVMRRFWLRVRENWICSSGRRRSPSGAVRRVAAGHERRVPVDRSRGGDGLLELVGGAACGVDSVVINGAALRSSARWAILACPNEAPCLWCPLTGRSGASVSTNIGSSLPAGSGCGPRTRSDTREPPR